jgi:hypothetical protein
MKAFAPPAPYLLAALLAGLVGLAASPVSATSALYLTEVEQAAESTAVVVARIGTAKVGVHPKWQRPITTTTVHVEELLLGSAPEMLTIEQFGGTIDGQTLYIPGDARFERGERCVLFLRQVDGDWFLTAMQQSKYEIRQGPRAQFLTRALSDGLFLRTEQGLKPMDEPPQKPVQTLAELRTVLRSAFGRDGEKR